MNLPADDVRSPRNGNSPARLLKEDVLLARPVPEQRSPLARALEKDDARIAIYVFNAWRESCPRLLRQFGRSRSPAEYRAYLALRHAGGTDFTGDYRTWQTQADAVRARQEPGWLLSTLQRLDPSIGEVLARSPRARSIVELLEAGDFQDMRDTSDARWASTWGRTGTLVDFADLVRTQTEAIARGRPYVVVPVGRSLATLGPMLEAEDLQVAYLPLSREQLAGTHQARYAPFHRDGARGEVLAGHPAAYAAASGEIVAERLKPVLLEFLGSKLGRTVEWAEFEDPVRYTAMTQQWVDRYSRADDPSGNKATFQIHAYKSRIAR